MFAALFAWLSANAGQIAFSILVSVLQKTGVLTKVEAGAVKTSGNMLRTVEHMKTYAQYPTGKNGAGTVLNTGTTS